MFIFVLFYALFLTRITNYLGKVEVIRAENYCKKLIVVSNQPNLLRNNRLRVRLLIVPRCTIDRVVVFGGHEIYCFYQNLSFDKIGRSGTYISSYAKLALYVTV